MTSRFTRLSGRDETSCKFSSRAKSLWNLRQSPRCGPTTSYNFPWHPHSTQIDTDYTAVELQVFHPATLGKVVEVTLDLQESELWKCFVPLLRGLHMKFECTE